MQLAGGAALSLLPGDSFASVLDDLHAGRYYFPREYTPTMNPRRANDEPEARITRIDLRLVGGGGSSFEIGFDAVSPLPYIGRLGLEQVSVVKERSGHFGVRGSER